MIIYIEKKIQSLPQVKQFIDHYKSPEIVYIDNYKNIFDKHFAGKIEHACVLASVNNAILNTPDNYGFSGKGYFLKNSLNCVYDCSYCYLKGAFKNNIPVYFLNYEDIKKQIIEVIKPGGTTWFYSSDYSDNLATDALTGFTKEFIPFFETLGGGMMEIRTKSVNIEGLLEFKNIKNTEIAFSLNPQEIVKKYEIGTPSLDMRIQAIQKLQQNGWKVGIRFLPLLEVPNYQKIYDEFLEYIGTKIDFNKVHSVFIGGLMYTQEDYSKILRKNPELDILYTVYTEEDGFVREKKEVRERFYQAFSAKVGKCGICLDGN